MPPPAWDSGYSLIITVSSGNAFSPILVTLFGIVTSLRALHSQNAFLPISVTLLGIITSVRALQPQNAHSPISVTLSGIFTSEGTAD